MVSMVGLRQRHLRIEKFSAARRLEWRFDSHRLDIHYTTIPSFMDARIPAHRIDVADG